jgi:hypothetical protein
VLIDQNITFEALIEYFLRLDGKHGLVLEGFLMRLALEFLEVGLAVH